MSQLTRPLEVIETEINFYKQQTATGIIEIGKRLIEAKSQLQHGEWGKWLESKIEFSDRTARQFMKVAEEFSTSEIGKRLPISKLYALLDVPTEERETFIQQNNVEEMTTRQLQEAIKAKKEAEARVQNLSSQLQELKNNQSKVVEKVIEKEIVKQVTPPDYEQIKQKAQKLEESYLKASQEANTAKNEARAYKDALEAKRLEGADILSPKNFAIDVNNFLRKISPMLYYGEQFEKMQASERNMFYEQIEKLEIACQDIRRAIDGEKGGANLIIIDK